LRFRAHRKNSEPTVAARRLGANRVHRAHMRREKLDNQRTIFHAAGAVALAALRCTGTHTHIVCSRGARIAAEKTPHIAVQLAMIFVCLMRFVCVHANAP
jgi:hypothetical protein